MLQASFDEPPLPEDSFLAFDPPGGRVKSVNRLSCTTQKPRDLQAVEVTRPDASLDQRDVLKITNRCNRYSPDLFDSDDCIIRSQVCRSMPCGLRFSILYAFCWVSLCSPDL